MSTLNPHEFNVHGLPCTVQLKGSTAGMARWLTVSNPVRICQNVSASASVPTRKKASQARSHDLPVLPAPVASLAAELSVKLRVVASITRRPPAGEPRCGLGTPGTRATPAAAPALRAVRGSLAARTGLATGPPPRLTRQRSRDRARTRSPP